MIPQKFAPSRYHVISKRSRGNIKKFGGNKNIINEIDNITRGLSNKELGNISDSEKYKEMLLSLADLKKNNPKGFN